MPVQDWPQQLLAAQALRSHPINASAHPNFGSHHEHQDWPFIRLLLVTGVATVASVGNIFTVSAIIVDELLQKKGNTFLVSMTLADMLVTTLVLPGSAAALLAEMENSENLCRFQYGVSSMGCVTAAVSIAAMGIENYLRLRNLRRAEDVRTSSITSATMVSGLTAARPGLVRPKTSVCTVAQVTVLNLLIWLFSGLVVLMHFSMMPELMYEICRYQDGEADYQYRMLMSLTLLTLFTLISILLGGLGFLKAVSVMRAWDQPKPYFTAREFAVVWANFWNWLLRLCILGPCLVIAITSQAQKFGEQEEGRQLGSSRGLRQEPQVQDPNDPPTAFQRLIIWSVIIPPCCCCIVNACANKDFRLRYKQLFHYCCCKTSVAITRRRGDNSRGASDVRVHIIPGYNMYSSATMGHSETTASASFGSRGFKCRPFMHYKRDVYEL